MDLSTTPVPIALFDTAEIESSLRQEAWNENIGVLFDVSTGDQQRLNDKVHARVEVTTFGGTVFGITEANSQYFARSSARIAREDVDHILIQVFLKGGGVTRKGVRVNQGDMLVIDLDQPHEMMNSDFTNLTLVLPRDVHPALSDLLTPLHSRQLASTDPMVRHMADHLSSLWENMSDMSLLAAETALAGSLNLLENWLSSGCVPDLADTNVSTALSKVIKRYIERHLSSPMSPEALAANFRMSRSQLYRMFEDDGGVARYIWDRRLRKAMRLLTRTTAERESVVAVAIECGFTSEAHFSRAFRSRYGVPPSKAREQLLDERQSGFGAHQSNYGTDLADWIRGLGTH